MWTETLLKVKNVFSQLLSATSSIDLYWRMTAGLWIHTLIVLDLLACCIWYQGTLSNQWAIIVQIIAYQYSTYAIMYHITVIHYNVISTNTWWYTNYNIYMSSLWPMFAEVKWIQWMTTVKNQMCRNLIYTENWQLKWEQ